MHVRVIEARQNKTILEVDDARTAALPSQNGLGVADRHHFAILDRQRRDIGMRFATETICRKSFSAKLRAIKMTVVLSRCLVDSSMHEENISLVRLCESGNYGSKQDQRGNGNRPTI